MLGSSYLPEHMGTATLSPAGPFVAGTHAALVLTYTAGRFGIDDTGDLKVVWRGTSDMGKPQFENPTAENYTTVEASNGAVLHARVDRNFTRPWVNALSIRVGRGFLRSGETITIRLGDTRQGSPGLRLQTNVEPTFEFKVLVDAFATYEFTELPRSPEIALIAGPAARWKALLPSQNIVGEPFRLCIVAEDRWGNPTAEGVGPVRLKTSSMLGGLPDGVLRPRQNGTFIVEELVAREPGDISVEILSETGALLCQSTPLRVIAGAPYRHYWGDLHAQSEETIGTNSADDYFAYARDKAFIDIVGHQGNDFQITDAFWKRLNELTRQFNASGSFVALPGYEWSGNTGMGGDRNVFYRTEGKPIRRSSRVLVSDPSNEDCYTANELFAALDRSNEDAILIAHVGGRYADIKIAHDGRFERAVEVHSTWGTFEWLLHDAFDRGYRVGIVCHSDDHKGRPGATPARRLHLRRHRRIDLLPDAEARPRRGVRGAAAAPPLRYHRHPPLYVGEGQIRPPGGAIRRRSAARANIPATIDRGVDGRHRRPWRRHHASRGRRDRLRPDRAHRHLSRQDLGAHGSSIIAGRSGQARPGDVERR